MAPPVGRSRLALTMSLAWLATSQGNNDGGDSEYFKYYEHPDIHRQMLQDTLRTEAYREALTSHETVRGKVVMDFGCGTGILSLFAASAGAKKVYCIEASRLAPITQQIIDKNGYSSVIKVVNQRGEDLKLPEKVDIIVSEWMGYFLVLEDMLTSLLVVRDKWLKPGGLMMPRYTSIWAQAYSDSTWWAENPSYWQAKPYGFDLSPMGGYATTDDPDWPWPIRSQWRPSGLVGEPHCVVDWDLNGKDTAAKGGLHLSDKKQRWDSTFELRLDDQATHGLVFWFDVDFEHAGGNVTLSTHPAAGVQHWGNILWPLRGAPLTGENLTIKGKLRLEHAKPAWKMAINWRAPPVVRRMQSHNTGDMYAEMFGNQDQSAQHHAYVALLERWATAAGTGPRSEL